MVFLSSQRWQVFLIIDMCQLDSFQQYFKLPTNTGSEQSKWLQLIVFNIIWVCTSVVDVISIILLLTAHNSTVNIFYYVSGQ